MSRINAGSTLANQYAPPFVVSNSVATNWQLRWNANIIAFEAFDPSENVVELGFTSINSAIFPNASQQVFVVPFIPDTTATIAKQKASFIITIQGLKQHQDAYTIFVDAGSGVTSITLSESVVNETVEVVGLQGADGAATVDVKSFTGDGAETDFALDWLAPSVQSLIITIDGVKQQSNAYSIIPNPTLTATDVIFSEAPGLNVTSAAIAAGGTGYTVGDILEVQGGTLRAGPQVFPATLRVTTEAAGIVTAVSVYYPGDYATVPANPIAVTGGTGADDATFNLSTTGEAIEVIGLLTAGETPASPVTLVNAAGGVGTDAQIFKSKTLSGDTQIFNLRELAAGTNVTITENANYITINATGGIADLTQSVGGTSLFNDAIPANGKFRTLSTAGDRIALTVDVGVNEAININYNFAYANLTAATLIMTTERLVNVVPFAGGTTITLPTAASPFVPGDTITIKDAAGTAGTNNIAVTPDVNDNIDGAADGVAVVLNTNRAYLTLYSDGADWHIIAQG